MDKIPFQHRAATDISEVAATPAPRSLSDDSGPLSLATALLQERSYFALDYPIVGPLL